MAKNEPMHVYPVPDGRASQIPLVDSSPVPVDTAVEEASTDATTPPPAPAGPDQRLL
jgi:hypothetical protein